MRVATRAKTQQNDRNTTNAAVVAYHVPCKTWFGTG